MSEPSTEMDIKAEDRSEQVSGTVPATDRPKQTAKAPRSNTGWAWVVVCGAFVVYFASVGFVASLSVYLTIWMEYFDTSAVTAGLVISIGLLMRGVLSPVAGALCTKFGPRAVTMVGGVIIVTGASMASQSPSIEFLMFSYGFVAAFGGSMVYIAAVHVLGMYFQNNYALAIGLSSAGVSAGQLAFPPLVTYLIELYGWRGSMLVTAAINLNIIAAGALMRPVVKKRQKRARRREEDTHQSGLDQVATNGNVSKVGDRTDTTQNCIVEAEGDREGTSSDELDDESDYRDVAVIIADNASDSADPVTEENVHPIETIVNPFVAAIAQDGLDQLTIAESVIDDQPESVFVYFVHYFSELKHFFLDTFGLRRLVHNMRFILTITVAFIHGFGKLGITYVVPRAESVGIDLTSSALLLSFFGAGSIIARISYGWFVDKKYITAEMTYALALLAFSLTVSLTPVFVDFVPLAILATLLGMAAGTSASIVMVTVRSQVQHTDASAAVAVVLLFTSVGNVAGIFVSGVAYDAVESYDIAFFIAGGVVLVSSLLCVVVYFLQKAKQFKRHLPAAMFYAKLPKELTKTQPTGSALGQPDTELGDDLGMVNPVCMLNVEEVLDKDEVTRDPDMLGAVQKKKKLLRKPRFGQKREVYEIEGIENPLTVVEGSADITAGENVKSEIDKTILHNYDFTKEDTTSDYSSNYEDMPEDNDMSLKAGISDGEGQGSSLPAEETQSSTSSLAEDGIERGFTNPTFDEDVVSRDDEDVVSRDDEDVVSRDDEDPVTDGSNIGEFDAGFEIENLGFDGDISYSDSDDKSCYSSGQPDRGDQNDRL